MKNAGTWLAAAFLAVVLVLYMCTFQVRFTEVAIRKTWGNPAKDAITEPGLKFKWPRPIQSVVVYDKRIHILEDRTEETRTVDGKNLLLTTYTLWKITDPIKFHTNFPAGVEDGEKRLRTTVRTHKHAITGQHAFSDFVSMDPKKRKLREIENKIRVAVARDAAEEYGIEVVDFGLKKLGLPETVTTAIFQSMRAHEEAKRERYIAEGEARASDIYANAKATEERIMAEVDRKVAQTRAEAEQIVSAYYKEFERSPHLRMFLDSLRTVSKALRSRTTLILHPDQAPWNIFDAEMRARIPLEDGLLGPTSEKPLQRLKTTSIANPD